MELPDGWIQVSESPPWIEYHYCSRCRLVVRQRIYARNAWGTKFLALCTNHTNGSQVNEVS